MSTETVESPIPSQSVTMIGTEDHSPTEPAFSYWKNAWRIITAPATVVLDFDNRATKTAIAGILLYIIGSVSMTTLQLQSIGWQNESNYVLNQIEAYKSGGKDYISPVVPAAIRTPNFAEIGQLGGLALFQGFAFLLFFSVITWYVQRLSIPRPMTFYPVLSLVGISMSINGLGKLVTGISAVVFDSMRWSPNFGILVSPFDRPFLHNIFLSNIEFFFVWQMIAVGLVVSFQLGVPKKYGYYLALFLVLLLTMLYAGMGSKYFKAME